MRRYQHIMAMLRTKRIWERRCIQCKHSIILCMSWLISRLRHLALLRNPTLLDFAMSEMKRAPTQALNFISSTPEKIAILVSKGKQEKICSIYIHLHTLFCSLQLANGMPAVADPPSTSALATHSSCPTSEDFQSHRICFTSCYNETVYNQNTSLPFWHRFDVSDQDERCLDISRFKSWMSIIVRSWKQGLQSIIPVAEEAVFYTQTWTGIILLL